MENLIIYKKAIKLIKEIYLFIKTNEVLRKDFSLNDQIKRSTISVVLNIAEGYGRGIKQFKNYLRISVGSINETIAILQIIEEVYKLDTKNLQKEYLILAKQVSSFSNKLIPAN